MQHFIQIVPRVCTLVLFSFSIRLLGFFKCSWWHPRQANDAAASERNILGKNHNCNFFSALHESVGTYILFWDLHAQGGKKLRRNIHTHNNSITLAAHAYQGLIKPVTLISVCFCSLISTFIK